MASSPSSQDSPDAPNSLDFPLQELQGRRHARSQEFEAKHAQFVVLFNAAGAGFGFIPLD